MANKLTLKWGTLKRWYFDKPEAIELMKEYIKIGSSASVIAQHDTPRQKEIICTLIDLTDEDIYLDWDGIYVNKEKAKEYVNTYGNKK